MVELLSFILVCYGLTQVLVFADVFDSIRPKYHFFHCPMCVGFWSGSFLFGINGFTELFTFDYNLANFFILSWLSSGTSYLLDQFMGDDGFRLEVKRDD